MGPGPLIAIDVILLYTLLGPVVLFGVYVLFDAIERSGQQGKTSQQAKGKKDPALWTLEDVEASDSDGVSVNYKS